MTHIDLIPPTEAERLVAVRRYDILDTPPDGAFDRIAGIAARVCDVPISTITIVDEDRIWFKSAIGIDGVTQIDRDPGLCASAILQDATYIVTDADLDPRTLDNPLVCGDLGLRFYAAVPLRTSDGHNLGTLNVIDTRSRELTDAQVATLEDLAAVVVDELELRLAAKRSIELESLRTAAGFRDSMVEGLSHEMRTPIAILRGLSDLLDHEEDFPGDRVELHELLARQVHRLDRLVERFLGYASLGRGELPTKAVAPTPLAPLLDEVVELHRDRGPIDLQVPGGLPVALVDPARTVHVISELLDNAVRFSSRPGGVSVSAEFDAEDASLRIAVDDRGPGLSEGALEHLFEHYYRSPASTGSGIGLYVARVLAEAQGGRIEVTSTPGVGSRFVLVVPADL